MGRRHAGSDEKTPTSEHPGQHRRCDDVDNRGAGHRLIDDLHIPAQRALREFITLIITIVVAVAGTVGTVITAYRVLQSADAQASARIKQIEDHVATKADLHALAQSLRLCIVQPSSCFELDGAGKAANHTMSPTKGPTP
jgi:hypothetical protein